MQLVLCPECSARVIANEDGTCPACGKSIQPPNEASATNRVRSFLNQRANERPLGPYAKNLIMTPGIVGTVIAVFVMMVISGVKPMNPQLDKMILWGANDSRLTFDGQWWRVVTSMFLHFGVIHLGFNMWVLWDVGRFVERIIGNTSFLILYFFAGIVGSLTSLAWHPVSVGAGASGAVFGVFGGLLGLIAFRRDIVPLPVLKPLRNSVAMFLIFNLIIGLSIPFIDMAAHTGGFVAGFLFGWCLSNPFTLKRLPTQTKRNVAMGIVATLVVILLGYGLQHLPHKDLHIRLQRADELLKTSANTFNRLQTQVQSGLTNAQFAEAIKEQVIPPWNELIELTREFVSVRRLKKRFSKRLRYYQTRKDAWELQIQGLSENDDYKLKAAEQKHEEAAQILKSIDQ